MKYLLAAAAGLALLAGTAMAKDVNKATIRNLESGGLQGGVGCLYVTTDSSLMPGGLVTLPLSAVPNTPQLTAVANITTHPTLSFNLGASSGACPGAPEAPTILLPSTP